MAPFQKCGGPAIFVSPPTQKAYVSPQSAPVVSSTLRPYLRAKKSATSSAHGGRQGSYGSDCSRTKTRPDTRPILVPNGQAGVEMHVSTLFESNGPTVSYNYRVASLLYNSYQIREVSKR